MMDIPVDDQNAIDLEAFDSARRADGDASVKTKAHGVVRSSMVSRRPDDAQSSRGIPANHRLHSFDHGSRSQSGGLLGPWREPRIRLDLPASASRRFADRLEVGRGVHFEQFFISGRPNNRTIASLNLAGAFEMAKDCR